MFNTTKITSARQDGNFEKNLVVSLHGSRMVCFDVHTIVPPGYGPFTRSGSYNITAAAAYELGKALIEAAYAASPSALPPRAPTQPQPTPKARPHGAQEYKGNGRHDWERVTKSGPASITVERLRVPGGWLYRDNNTLTDVFVPMPTTVNYPV